MPAASPPRGRSRGDARPRRRPPAPLSERPCPAGSRGWLGLPPSPAPGTRRALIGFCAWGGLCRRLMIGGVGADCHQRPPMGRRLGVREAVAGHGARRPGAARVAGGGSARARRGPAEAGVGREGAAARGLSCPAAPGLWLGRLRLGGSEALPVSEGNAGLAGSPATRLLLASRNTQRRAEVVLTSAVPGNNRCCCPPNTPRSPLS